MLKREFYTKSDEELYISKLVGKNPHNNIQI